MTGSIVSRRRFLAALVGLPLAGTLGAGFPPAARSAGALEPRLRAAEIAFGAADLAALLRPVPWTDGAPAWLSPPLGAPLPFLAAAPLWLPQSDGALPVTVALRFSPDGLTWGHWLSTDAESPPEMTPRELYAGRLLFVEHDQRARYLQVRVHGQPLARLVLALHDAEGGPTAAEAARDADAPLQPLTLALPGTPRPKIINRAAWGCPDGDKSPRWPPEYTLPTHVVIHHTATSNTATDWAQQVRIVWDYHARTQRWGDTGYNFLVDPQGNIYEGRAGGDNVVGAHVYMFNHQTVGIALLGTFTGQTPTPAAREALSQLVAWTCGRRMIDPRGQSPIVLQRSCGSSQVTKPGLGGHRDFSGHSCSATDPNGTACPGNLLYTELSTLRARAASLMRGLFITEATFNATGLRAGQRLDLRVTVWNNTGEVVRSDANPPPGFVYNEGQPFTSKSPSGFIRIGVDYAARTGPPEYPYRWGLGGDLKPGERRTITGAVVLRTERATDYWVTLVHEWVGFAEQFARTRIAYDLTPPTVSLDPLPAFVYGPVRVSWQGSDAASGIATYDVEVREAPSGPWQPWVTATAATSGLYKGKQGKSYEFRARGRDLAGNTSAFVNAPPGANRALVVSENYRVWMPAARR